MSNVADLGPPRSATPGSPSPDGEGDHRPVLLHPLIEHLQPRPGQVCVDGTLGAGGVTAALAECVRPGGLVIAVDRDPAAVERGRRRFRDDPTVRVVHGDFADIDRILAAEGHDHADVITLDLGISSVQLDDPVRGFAFRFEGPLDMRLDPTSGDPTAADLVATLDEHALVTLIRDYGEERFARSIAGAIVRRRRDQPLTTTVELRELVARAIPRRLWPKRIHPATKTFQALRIAVNHELESLEHGLQAAITALRPGGRLGVISFHSLEDTLVKNALHVAALTCLCPPQQPICTCAHRASLSLRPRKAVKADDAELIANPRSRSARLRVAVRLDDA